MCGANGSLKTKVCDMIWYKDEAKVCGADMHEKGSKI